MKWSEVSQSCPSLCDPMDYSLPGSSAHGIFQAIVLEWIAISFSRGSSQSRDRTQVSHIVDTLPSEPPGMSINSHKYRQIVAGVILGIFWILKKIFPIHSVQFSCSIMSNSLRPYVVQRARPPCPLPTPRAYSPYSGSKNPSFLIYV